MKIDQSFQAVIINFTITNHRCDKRNPTSFEHLNYSLINQ